MTARELIKFLEGCDLDKNVALLITATEEVEFGYQVLIREVVDVLEKHEFIIIQ